MFLTLLKRYDLRVRYELHEKTAEGRYTGFMPKFADRFGNPGDAYKGSAQ